MLPLSYDEKPCTIHRTVSAHGLKLELTPQGQNVNFSYSRIDCQLGNLRNFNPRLVVLPNHDRNHQIKSRKCSYRF